MKILLIQDQPEYAAFLKDTLSKTASGKYELITAPSVAAATPKISAGDMDIILLDLTLPDSTGFDTFEKIQNQAPSVPIVILSDLDDEMMAFKAVRSGAQDYLLKSEIEGKLLSHVIRYAVERNRVKNELVSMSFLDDLTGLYNRRGFMILAEQQFKLSLRTKRPLLVAIADLDNLKQINDTYGHREGDLALTKTAVTLKETFRKSDIVSRLSGDEFAIVAVEADKECGEILASRLQKNLDYYNQAKQRSYVLSLSIGFVSLDPEVPATIEDMLIKADEVLYQVKRRKKTAAATQAQRII